MTGKLDNTNGSDVEDTHELLKNILQKSTLEGDFTNLKMEFCETYHKFSKQEFQNSFKLLLMTAFCTQGRIEEMKRLFNFIAECVIKLDTDHKKKFEDQSSLDVNQSMHPLLLELLQLLGMWSKANCSVVRSHSHLMLSALLTKLQEFGLDDVDVSVFEVIAEVVQRGRKDVCSSVRAQAVLLAKFIQDPTVEDDVIINGLCWQLESDPSFKVRQNILEILAPCEETVLPVLERYLYDKNEHVRNAGLLYICDKISPQSFRKDQRCLILHHCMFDDSKLVRKTAENRLIPVWLRSYGDKLSTFLSDLHLKDQHFENLRFLKKLLTIIIGTMTLNQIMDDIGLDKELRVLSGPLTAEKVFIWRTFCEIASQDKKYMKYLPTTENYSAFITKYLQNLSDDDDPCVCHELIKLQIHFQEKFENETWPNIVPDVFDLVRNPYVSKIPIPIAVKYLRDFSPQSERSVQEQLIETMSTFKLLYDAVSDQHKLKIMLKCITIVSEMLNNDVISWLSDEIKSIKDSIILPLIESESEEVRNEAIRALTLYCLLDANEAKQLRTILLQSSNKNGPYSALKSLFDVLLHYGPQYFDSQSEDSAVQYKETVTKCVQKSHKGKQEERIIVADGTFKLYLAKKLRSPEPLSQVMLLMFLPDSPQTIKIRFSQFLLQYQKFKLDADLLAKAYLKVVETLFQCPKTSPFFKISIKDVVNSFLGFSKLSVQQEPISTEEGGFMDRISLMMTKNYIQKPTRMSSADLQSILSQVTLTSNATSDELRRNVNLVVKQLDCPTVGKKRCFHTKKFFFNFSKKIPSPPSPELSDSTRVTSFSQLQSDDAVDIQCASSPPLDEDAAHLSTKPRIEILSASDSSASESLDSFLPIEGTSHKSAYGRHAGVNRSSLFTLSPIAREPVAGGNHLPVESESPEIQQDLSPILNPSPKVLFEGSGSE